MVAGEKETEVFRMWPVFLHVVWISSFVKIISKELFLLLEISQNKWKCMWEKFKKYHSSLF